jgi:hypothetical protein
VLWLVALSLYVHAIATRPLQRDIRIAKLEGDVEDVYGRVQRLSGRIGRQKQLDEGPTDTDVVHATKAGDFKQRKNETPEQWKARTRLLLQQGLKPH